MNFIELVKHKTQLRWNKVHRFKPKHKFLLEVGPYIIKTAESVEELMLSFKLRHDVFNFEFKGIYSPGYDFDKFDYYFDHLIIIHKHDQRVIGTYRLHCPPTSRHSYTAIEFNLVNLGLASGIKLELGRACIHKDYRKGSVISLLWRGIAEYMKISSADFLYGCSSIKINHAQKAALVYQYLIEEGQVSTLYNCSPTRKYCMNDFDIWLSFYSKGLTVSNKVEADNLIPSLLKSYLKLGAKVASEPAYDEEFDCIDLLTVLNRKDLSNSLAQRFQIN